MIRFRRFTVLASLVAILSLGLGATVMAGGSHYHNDKVEICHLAANKYVKIRVAESAVDAHLAHGDSMVDDYGECPGGGTDPEPPHHGNGFHPFWKLRWFGDNDGWSFFRIWGFYRWAFGWHGGGWD